MEQIFITNITIKKVRHLRYIFIPLSEEKAKHLILTGKNGSGKTSVIEALTECLNEIVTGGREDSFRNCQQQLDIILNRKMECIP